MDNNKECRHCQEIKDTNQFNRYPNNVAKSICMDCEREKELKRNLFLINKRICLTCSHIKELNSFVKSPTCLDGYREQCSECRKIIYEQESSKNHKWLELDNWRKEKQKLLENGLKYCGKCDNEKPVEEFSFNKEKTDGYNPNCKNCVNNRSKEHYEINKENRRKQISKWREKNPNRVKEYNRNWGREKRKTNIQYRIKSSLRGRIRELIHTKDRSKGLMIKTLGCTIPDFIKYLELLWADNMSWDNYGKWEIEHEICCNVFDLSDIRQQNICFHYSNLRPMWANDNYRKSDFLVDGRRARNLSPQEKLDYLRSLGFDV